MCPGHRQTWLCGLDTCRDLPSQNMPSFPSQVPAQVPKPQEHSKPHQSPAHPACVLGKRLRAWLRASSLQPGAPLSGGGGGGWERRARQKHGPEVGTGGPKRAQSKPLCCHLPQGLVPSLAFEAPSMARLIWVPRMTSPQGLPLQCCLPLVPPLPSLPPPPGSPTVPALQSLCFAWGSHFAQSGFCFQLPPVPAHGHGL